MGWRGLPRIGRITGVACGIGRMRARLCAAALLALTLLAVILAAGASHAGGWASVHRYVKPSGNCAGEDVLASYYWTGRRTATGEAFDANGNTAAARTWPLGATLTITNPHNGRSISVRINDKGTWGIAYAQGARLDLARGAARRLGMQGTQYVCVSQGGMQAETHTTDALARDIGARQD
jgi:rare lipoprotein A (peptidoglycan hydrolase)